MLQLLDFWSPTCGPCKRLEPALVAFAKANKHAINPISINTAERANRNLVQKYKVAKVPTLILVADGRELARTIGVNPPTVDGIKRWVAPYADDLR